MMLKYGTEPQTMGPLIRWRRRLSLVNMQRPGAAATDDSAIEDPVARARALIKGWTDSMVGFLPESGSTMQSRPTMQQRPILGSMQAEPQYRNIRQRAGFVGIPSTITDINQDAGQRLRMTNLRQRIDTVRQRSANQMGRTMQSRPTSPQRPILGSMQSRPTSPQLPIISSAQQRVILS